MVRFAETLGLSRSLLIYGGRFWKNRALARFYAGLIGPGDLAFDIGAHIGNRTRALHRCGARVVALEPQPLFHRFLRLALPRERVILLPQAVASTPGRRPLHISSRYPTVSTLSRNWIETVRTADGFEGVDWDRSQMVEITTLDALIRDHGLPRLCKIDVEGLEADILQGLTQPIPCIAFEYLPAALPVAEECIDLLVALGPYRFNRVQGEECRFRHETWLSADLMRQDLREAAVGGRSGDIYARLH